MADVSKIKLPNNTEVNIKDSRISGIDSTPTSGSTNLVTSGGVNTALQQYKKTVFLSSEAEMPANPDSTTLYVIAASDTVASIIFLNDESEMPSTPDSNTLYIIAE